MKDTCLLGEMGQTLCFSIDVEHDAVVMISQCCHVFFEDGAAREANAYLLVCGDKL